MKMTTRTLALVLALTLLTSFACAFAKTYSDDYAPKQIDYCNEYVTLRAEPSGSARELKKVWLGEVVMAKPYNSEFSYCCYNGTFGYIKKRYLNNRVTGYSDGTFRIAHCKEWVSLRTMPIKDAKVLKRIPLGAKLDAVYYADGGYEPDAFAYVRYKGQYGWVLWDYLAPVSYPGGQ